jgi:hypothetical protein
LQDWLRDIRVNMTSSAWIDMSVVVAAKNGNIYNDEVG